MEYYDKIALSYNELHGEEQKKKLKIIEPYIKGKVLDVGCGTGIATPKNAIGIDPSKELLKQNPGKTVQGFAENLPFEDNSFDTVISLTAIHNFKNIEKGLNEIKRVGKERFILTVLKKDKNYEKICKLIKKIFSPNKIIDEKKDTIFIKT